MFIRHLYFAPAVLKHTAVCHVGRPTDVRPMAVRIWLRVPGPSISSQGTYNEQPLFRAWSEKKGQVSVIFPLAPFVSFQARRGANEVVAVRTGLVTRWLAIVLDATNFFLWLRFRSKTEKRKRSPLAYREEIKFRGLVILSKCYFLLYNWTKNFLGDKIHVYKDSVNSICHYQ